ncbi:helix-turn-helix domain-containing protein [Flavobacterium sp. 3HN19-14]|uniref:helix-turn-helix domain-containing protein n=1 Tax=Flavobacterium sp. 3HN19-14 TaxID=3448133 RepID=UPI003EDFAF33
MRRPKRGDLTPEQSCIVINIMPVLRARGVKFPDAYLKKIGISSFSATKLLRGEAIQIGLNQITKLCFHLNCTPNDLFALRDMELPPKHALHAIEKLKPVEEMKTVEEYLQGMSVGEVRKMLEG